MPQSNPHRVIRTEHYRPPHHDRSQDWAAWIDGMEEIATGYGATEAAARLDLLEQLDDRGAR